MALRCVLADPADLLPPAHSEPAIESEAEAEDASLEEAESESAGEMVQGPPGIRYTRDLSDEDLQRRWLEDLPGLGSISVGFADQGRLINAVHMPEKDPAFVLQRPELAWGAKETIDSLVTAFHAVQARFPGSAPARLSHIGARDGGFLRPHRSHQSGRDADIAFFYKRDAYPGAGARREKLIDPARSWTLLRALITQTDVQVILVDRGIMKVLREYAVTAGEDQAWLDRVFHAGKKSLVQHARHHRDHFHVRFFAPRSQELGRRIQPLLAQRPEQNLVLHRVKRGQTLGHIARTYAVTVAAIQKTNRIRGSFLHLGQALQIPLRKPCTRCPLPPAVTVPERCLPPAGSGDLAGMTASATAD